AQLQERPPLLVPAGSELAVAAEGVLQGDGLLAPLGKIPPVRDVELRRDVLAQAEEEGVAVALGDFHHVHSQGFLQRPAQGPVDVGDPLPVAHGRQAPGQRPQSPLRLDEPPSGSITSSRSLSPSSGGSTRNESARSSAGPTAST